MRANIPLQKLSGVISTIKSLPHEKLLGPIIEKYLGELTIRRKSGLAKFFFSKPFVPVWPSIYVDEDKINTLQNEYTLIYYIKMAYCEKSQGLLFYPQWLSKSFRRAIRMICLKFYINNMKINNKEIDVGFVTKMIRKMLGWKYRSYKDEAIQETALYNNLMR